MNCPEARIAMRAAIERDAPLDARVEAHLATCEDCSEDYGDWALDHALRLQQAPPPREGFVDQAIEYAIRRAASKRRYRFAMAASVAVVSGVLGLAYIGSRGVTTDVQAMAVTLTANVAKTVRVVIDSPVEQDGATVTIELADNLELTGFPNERRIEWQTDLSQGKNLLALPLTLTSATESHFHVALSYGATKKDVRVTVHPAVSGSEPKPLEARQA